MISHVEGRLDFKSDSLIVIDAGGVGYTIYIPEGLADTLPPEGELCKVHTHTNFREEDGTSLYGFASREDRELFRMLLTVSGVGPKVALGIMSGIGADDLMEAIITEDIKALTGISGVGKKTAQRLVLELKDKMADLSIARKIKRKPGDTSSDDAVDALMALGYSRSSALEAVAKAREVYREATKVEELIKASLRYL